MANIEKPTSSTTTAVPPTPGRPGRRKNIPLADLDANLESQCQEEAKQLEEANSSTKRVAKDAGGSERTKKKKKQRTQDSSDDGSDSSETNLDSDETSSSDCSVKSDEPRKQARRSGFIGFKGNALLTPDSKARLRKVQRLLESVANLVPKIDADGKDALKAFADEVREYTDFVKELIRSTRAEIPDKNPLKSKTVKQLKIIRETLIELGEDVDVTSEMPMMGSHILDWSDNSGLKKILGTKTARRLRTSLKGQKRMFKPIFKKSPADIARTWLSADERRKKNFNSRDAGYSRDNANSGRSRPNNSNRSGGNNSKNTGFGKNRNSKF